MTSLCNVRGSSSATCRSPSTSGSPKGGRPLTCAERMGKSRARLKQEKEILENQKTMQREQRQERKRRSCKKEKQVAATPPEESSVELCNSKDPDAQSSTCDRSASKKPLTSALDSPPSSRCVEAGRPQTKGKGKYRSRLKQEESKQIQREMLREQWRARKRKQRMKQKQADATNKEESVAECDNNLSNDDLQKQEHKSPPSSGNSHGKDVDNPVILDALLQSPVVSDGASPRRPLTPAERMRNYRERQKKKKELENIAKQNIDNTVIIVREKSDGNLRHGQAVNSCASEKVDGTALGGQFSSGCTSLRRSVTPAERTNYREGQMLKASLEDQIKIQREKWRESKRKSRSRQKQPTAIKFAWNSCNVDKQNSSKSAAEGIQFQAQAQESTEGKRALTAAERQRRYREKLKQSPEKWAEYKKKGLLASRRSRQNYRQMVHNYAEESLNSVDSCMSSQSGGDFSTVGPQSPQTAGSILGEFSLNGMDSAYPDDNPGSFQRRRRKRLSKHDTEEFDNQEGKIALKRAKARERTRRFRHRQKEKARTLENSQQYNNIPDTHIKELSNGWKDLSETAALNVALYHNQPCYIIDKRSGLRYGALPSVISNEVPSFSFQQSGANIPEQSAIPSDVQTLPFQRRSTAETTQITEDPMAQKRAKARERTRRYRLKQRAKAKASKNHQTSAEFPVIMATIDGYGNNGQLQEMQRMTNCNYFESQSVLRGDSVQLQMVSDNCRDMTSRMDANDSDIVVVYPEDIRGKPLPATGNNVQGVTTHGMSADTSRSSSRPMTAAERQRKYRERLKQCPEKFASYRQKQRQRYNSEKVHHTIEQQNRIRSLSVVRSRNYRNRKRQKELVNSSDRTSVGAAQNLSDKRRVEPEASEEHVEVKIPMPTYTRQKKYYENLRSSPDRYAAYKKKDSERKKRSRQQMTPEQIEMCRIKDRERQRRYRAKKRGLIHIPDGSCQSTGKGPSSSLLRGLSSKNESVCTSAKAKPRSSRKRRTKASQLVVVREMVSGTAEEGDATLGNAVQLKHGCADASMSEALHTSQMESQLGTRDASNERAVSHRNNDPKDEHVPPTRQEEGDGTSERTAGDDSAQGRFKGEFIVSSAGNIPVLIKPEVKGELFNEVVEEIAQVIPCDAPNVEFDWTELDLFSSDPVLDGDEGNDGEPLGHGEELADGGREEVGIVSGSARRKAFFPTRHDTADLTLNAANSLGVSNDCS